MGKKVEEEVPMSKLYRCCDSIWGWVSEIDVDEIAKAETSEIVEQLFKDKELESAAELLKLVCDRYSRNSRALWELRRDLKIALAESDPYDLHDADAYPGCTVSCRPPIP